MSDDRGVVPRGARVTVVHAQDGSCAAMTTEHHVPGDEDRRPDLYCRNCGDPFGPDAENAACELPSGSWRPCPNPSPGRPLVDCGVGGHMYTDQTPRIDLLPCAMRTLNCGRGALEWDNPKGKMR